jgi:tetratricopeptide (TPR) repeat protein
MNLQPKRFRVSSLVSGIVLLTLLWAHSPPSVEGQTFGRSIPSQEYFATFGYYYEGDYVEALDDFQKELRGSVKVGNARWLDSICYNAMVGECYYQLGRYDEAMTHFNASLQLYLVFSDWLGQVNFSAAVTAQPRTPSPWGGSNRMNALGKFPKTFPIRVGQLHASEQLQYGGVYQQAKLIPIVVQEIIRCTALSMRRRNELLGPLGKYDSLSGELSQVFGARPCLPNHWSGTWIDVQYGIALAGLEKYDEAVPQLQRGVTVLGQYDHPLTAVALVELGKIALKTGNYQKAKEHFYEASIAAWHYSDPVPTGAQVIEEALRYGAVAQWMIDRKKPFPPLTPALVWAKREDFRMLQVSLMESLAEEQVLAGNIAPAMTLLDQAGGVLMRYSMREGRLGARWNYLYATGAYANGEFSQAKGALDKSMRFMRVGSPWIYQIRRLESLYKSGKITTRGPITMRAAMDLYTELLREPTATDWNLTPIESMTVLTTPHSSSFERWFSIALARNDKEKAVEITDRTRRHRFNSTLSMGGRLFSLRTLFAASNDELPPEALVHRQDLILDYPKFAQLQKEVDQLKSQLQSLPLIPENEDQRQQQRQRLEEVRRLSRQQEALLRQLALRRVKSPILFPPVRSFETIRQNLPEKTALLVFFQAQGDMYGFLIDKDIFETWRLRSLSSMKSKISRFLREMGNYHADRPLDYDDLADEAWKETGKELMQGLLGGTRSADFTELAIVPDGAIWYVPFEALSVEVGGKLRPMIGVPELKIRYAPTASLAIPDRRGRSLGLDTVAIFGELHPKNETSLVTEAKKEMTSEIPRMIPLPPVALPGTSSVFATQIRQLVVMADIAPPEEFPFDWRPIPGAKSDAGELIGDWLPLPWGGPQLIVLPGFHTAAENAMKEGGSGRDLFLAVSALEACGARTILISRWRPGGKSTYDLIRNFLKAFADHPPAEAWKKAIFAVAGGQIVPEKEPRVKPDPEMKAPLANHPFFWASFMLIDRGEPAAETTSTETEGGLMEQMDRQMDDGEEDGEAAEEGAVEMESFGDFEDFLAPTEESDKTGEAPPETPETEEPIEMSEENDAPAPEETSPSEEEKP